MPHGSVQWGLVVEPNTGCAPFTRILSGNGASWLISRVPPKANPSIARGLARADALAAAGRQVDSLNEIGRVYEAGVKAFEGQV